MRVPCVGTQHHMCAGPVWNLAWKVRGIFHFPDLSSYFSGLTVWTNDGQPLVEKTAYLQLVSEWSSVQLTLLIQACTQAQFQPYRIKRSLALTFLIQPNTEVLKIFPVDQANTSHSVPPPDDFLGYFRSEKCLEIGGSFSSLSYGWCNMEFGSEISF